MKLNKLFLLLPLLLSGCGRNNDSVSNISNTTPVNPSTSTSGNVNLTKTGEAYSIVFYDYLGYCKVEVTNEVANLVTIDEAFLPSTWARIKIDEDKNYEHIVENNDIKYAKYIKIDNKTFIGTLRDNDLVIEDVKYSNQSIKYSNNEIEDLFVYLLDNEVNMKWYFEAASNKKLEIVDDKGDKLDYESNSGNEFIKSKANYWPQSESQLGWKGNIDEITKALVGTKIDASLNTIVKDGTWKIGDLSTGATLIGFLDYYQLAQKAFNNAKL